MPRELMMNRIHRPHRAGTEQPLDAEFVGRQDAGRERGGIAHDTKVRQDSRACRRGNCGALPVERAI
jgi:hypothetical protein